MNNFKKVCFGAATMAVMATGSTLIAESAQAAALTSGTLIIKTDTNVTQVNSLGDLNVTFGSNTVISKTGGFNSPAVLSGTAAFPALALVKSGANWVTGPITGFLSGLKLDGDDVFFDIVNPITFTGAFTSPTSYALTAPIINGRFRNSSGSILGNGGISALQFDSTTDSSTVNLSGTAIPTPALLPGLLGLGAAAWRKRKSEHEAVVA
jgi:hypothetical protein